MDLKFKVGDIIVYKGGDSVYDNEIDRYQEIAGVIDNIIYTVFKDTGETNNFYFNSRYYDLCDKVKNFEYSNGVPMLWEDEV